MDCDEKYGVDIKKSLCLFCDKKITSADEKDHDANCE